MKQANINTVCKVKTSAQHFSMVDERIASLHLQVEIWVVGCRIGGCMSWTLRWRRAQTDKEHALGMYGRGPVS